GPRARTCCTSASSARPGRSTPVRRRPSRCTPGSLSTPEPGRAGPGPGWGRLALGDPRDDDRDDREDREQQVGAEGEQPRATGPAAVATGLAERCDDGVDVLGPRRAQAEGRADEQESGPGQRRPPGVDA